jgi:hypothetical protein
MKNKNTQSKRVKIPGFILMTETESTDPNMHKKQTIFQKDSSFMLTERLDSKVSFYCYTSQTKTFTPSRLGYEVPPYKKNYRKCDGYIQTS